MTLAELQSRVIYQVNADEDDLSDYQPHLTGYLNQGYDRLLHALVSRRVPDAPFPALTAEGDVPKLPEWTHDALADYATYLVYRNGNPQKQSRGQAFLARFLEVESECKSLSSRMAYDAETGEIIQRGRKPPQFCNVYP